MLIQQGSAEPGADDLKLIGRLCEMIRIPVPDLAPIEQGRIEIGAFFRVSLLRSPCKPGVVPDL